MQQTAAHMPSRWYFLPIKPGNVLVGTFLGLTESTSVDSPLSGPMTLDSWISAAQGDPSGLWLLSEMAGLILPTSFTWGEFASIGTCPDDRVGVPVGDIRRDARNGQHGHGGGEADGAVDGASQGYERVIVGQWAAVGAEPAAGCFGKLFLPGSSAYRTEIGQGETGAGHGLLLRDRLGGIWEVASGANRPEPVPTELKQSL